MKTFLKMNKECGSFCKRKYGKIQGFSNVSRTVTELETKKPWEFTNNLEEKKCL